MSSAGHWLGNGIAVAAGTPAPDRFGGEDDERAPDEGERDQMRSGKRFVIEENAEKEAAARREVLEKAERREPKFAGGVAKPDERQASHNPGSHEQQRHRPAVGAERRIPGAL